MRTGKELFTIKMGEPCRAVNLSIGEGLLAFSTDAFMGTPPQVHICKFEKDIEQQTSKAVLKIDMAKGRTTRVYWTDLNRTLVTSHDGGWVRKWDSEVRTHTHTHTLADPAHMRLQLHLGGAPRGVAACPAWQLGSVHVNDNMASSTSGPLRTSHLSQPALHLCVVCVCADGGYADGEAGA